MSFCGKCGATVKGNYEYCMKCGTAISPADRKVAKTMMQPPPSPPPTYSPQTAKRLVRRNYIIWFLLGYLTSGVLMLVYQYYNFEDLRLLGRIRPPKEGPSLETDQNKIILYMVLSIFLGFIPVFGAILVHWKYDLLYKYLDNHPVKGQKMPMKAKRRTWLFVLQILFLIFGITLLSTWQFAFFIPSTWFGLVLGLFIGFGAAFLLTGIIISFYLIYCDHKWQEALNERILVIDPHAEEKMLF